MAFDAKISELNGINVAYIINLEFVLQIIRLSLFLFISLFIIALADIVLDWKTMGGWNLHIIVEMVFGLISVVIFFGLILFYTREKHRFDDNQRALKESLQKAHADLTESQEQSRKLMGEFGKILEEQFAKWQLTKSEKEVGLLLIKGLSLDEIAAVRETKEKTVRQQASSLYKKAGLAGRHELVGYFFEDLLLQAHDN